MTRKPFSVTSNDPWWPQSGIFWPERPHIIFLWPQMTPDDLRSSKFDLKTPYDDLKRPLMTSNYKIWRLKIIFKISRIFIITSIVSHSLAFLTGIFGLTCISIGGHRPDFKYRLVKRENECRYRKRSVFRIFYQLCSTLSICCRYWPVHCPSQFHFCRTTTSLLKRYSCNYNSRWLRWL